MSDIADRIAGRLGAALETEWGTRHIGGRVQFGEDEFEVTTENDDDPYCRLVLIHATTGDRYAIEVDVQVDAYHGAVTG